MKYVAFILASHLVLSTVEATEMINLSDWVNQPKQDREPSYLLVRCAGLHMGVISFVGTVPSLRIVMV